ncbi:MAG: ribosome silencing factor [Pseudomonadota bacterium]
MQKTDVKQLVIDALDELKANDVKVLDVKDLTSLTDWMVVASGRSNRHVKSLADKVVLDAKHAGHSPIGVEGAGEGEWVLVDLDEVVCHIMLPKIRDFYNLEKLWEYPRAQRAAEQ